MYRQVNRLVQPMTVMSDRKKELSVDIDLTWPLSQRQS